MSTKALILTAIILVCSACPLQAEVINSRWVGGERGEWETPSNWEPSIIPDNTSLHTFAVSIGDATSDMKIQLKQNHTINKLDCNGEVELDASVHWIELNLISGLTNHGYFETDRVHIKGDITNVHGATLRPNDDTDNQGDLENAGIVLVTPPGIVQVAQNLNNTGKIQMFGGFGTISESLDNDVNGFIEGFGETYSEQQIQNRGTIYASGGSLVVFTDKYLINSGILGNKPVASLHVKPAEDVNNIGTIEVNAGGGVAFDCNMVNEPNAVIKLLNGTLAAKKITQKAGATFQGFGGITGNVVIDPNAVIKLTGPTNIVGDVTIGEGATLDISDGTVLITGLTTCNGGTIKTFHGSIITQGGTSDGICNRIFVD